MTAPRVFISYSHDSEDHKSWVLALATDLRNQGVDATLDQWELVPGQDVSSFMQEGILEANRVILVCTESYVAKSETGSGGVGFERLIVTSEVVQSIDTEKFIPLVRNNPNKIKVPRFLGPRLFIDFSDDFEYEAKKEELLRELLGAPKLVKPPLGGNPFSGELPTGSNASSKSEAAEPSVPKIINLSESWFETEHVSAAKGLGEVHLTGCMELRLSIQTVTKKSQLDLLDAVRKSEIHTFGWPIGITLENRDEYKPRPYGDGIRAKIAIPEGSLSGRRSYDYWAARENGDFYLLQSLFEDTRKENELFFNTRIVRVTEALMFASNLYANLGVLPDTSLGVRISHHGLANRTLTSASPNRTLCPTKKSHEDTSETEIAVLLSNLDQELIGNVRRICDPMFMLFEFQEISLKVYKDIITRFRNGETS